ncbi:hypothetical protein HanPI659440_Chr15g0602381 [Helianthus annuus]|nr:hypothetical protein HanPI659440_Chr15g0602381 [Helianthus annuus]
MMAACDTFLQEQLSSFALMRVGFRSRYLKRDMRKTLRLLLRKQFRKPPVTDQTLFSAGRTQVLFIASYPIFLSRII